MGKTKLKTSSSITHNTKRKKINPLTMHANLSYWLMTFLFSKIIGHHIELGLLPLLKNAGTY